MYIMPGGMWRTCAIWSTVIDQLKSHDASRPRTGTVFKALLTRFSPVRQNIVANLAGNGATAIATLLCTPIYVRLLGIESYGLIGVYMTLQTLSIFLDMGLGTTINREIARLSVGQDSSQEMRNLVRTLEVVYWLFGAVICVGIVALAPLVVNNWLHLDRITPSEGTQAIRLAGLAIGLRWPLTLYSGGMMGLQRQVSLNGILGASAIVQSVGAVIVLRVIGPTISVFFVWQIVMAIVPSIWARQSLLRCLPVALDRAVFTPSAIWSLWRFTAGAGAFTLTSMLLNQVDKLALSKMASLESFGYYNLAGVAANAIYRLVGPVFSALFPLFSGLVNGNELKRLTSSYHKGCELVSLLIFPATAVGVVFSESILLVWTRNAQTSMATHTTMSFLVAGSAVNALIYVPYALQLAYGWTTLGVYMNVFGLVSAGAFLPFTISHYGASGAAAVKLLVSCVVFAVGPCVMHRRILRGETWRWYVSDVAKPFAVSFAVALACAGVAEGFKMGNRPQWFEVVFLLAVFLLTSVSTILAVKGARLPTSLWPNRLLGWIRQ